MVTSKNLQDAFAGESQANRKYLAFAQKAEADGYPQVARLFRAAAGAETVHAHAHLRAMGGIKATTDNLQAAIEGEGFEFQEMYPPYLAQAREEGNRRAAISFENALAVEEIHYNLYVEALAAVKDGKDLSHDPKACKEYINKNASDKATVNTGRISAAVALIIACIMAPLLGGIDQAFQFIQEYTGIVSPGILAVFILGLFWKKTTNKAAIIGALVSIPIAMYFKVAPKGWSDNPVFVDVPWMDQMGYSAILTAIVIIVISLTQNRGANDEKAIPISKELFKTSPGFNIGAFVVMLILVALYAIFWK